MGIGIIKLGTPFSKFYRRHYKSMSKYDIGLEKQQQKKKKKKNTLHSCLIACRLVGVQTL